MPSLMIRAAACVLLLAATLMWMSPPAAAEDKVVRIGFQKSSTLRIVGTCPIN